MLSQHKFTAFQLRASGGVDSNNNTKNDKHNFPGEHEQTFGLVGGYLEDMERKGIQNVHTEMNGKCSS